MLVKVVYKQQGKEKTIVAQNKVTSRDVAKRAGVSRTTVSFVLNDVEAKISEETRQRVLAAAAELNYVPHAAAQTLAGQRTQIIALVFPRVESHLPTHFFLLQVMDGLLKVAHEHGLRLMVDFVADGDSGQSYLHLVHAQRIDGLVMIDPRKDDPALQALVEDGFPLVLIGHLPDLAVSSVDVDNAAAARSAVEHLLSLGHRRIACITNAPPTFFTATEERLRGYRDALQAAEIPFEEGLVRYATYTPESGFDAMSALLDEVSAMPTAVFVASDVVAFGALAAIHERKLRVPDDIAVVGFDDVPLSRFVNPPLTTVRLPAAEQGRKAGEMLFDLITERTQPGRRTLLETELIVRASSVRG